MDSIEPTMLNYTTQNPLSQFNMDLLEKKLADTDSLVRSYYEKCEENKQIQANLESITESAQKIQQMYISEKAQKEKLQIKNTELEGQLNAARARLLEIENAHINNNTINIQTIAVREQQLEEVNSKYLELCESFVKQGSILHANNLSTTELMRKCTSVKDVLKAKGILFEWRKSPTKQQRKSGAIDKVKTKATRTLGTQLNQNELCDISKKLCDKSTQYQQMKATRSTCTSAFITKVDAGVNTEHSIEQMANTNPISTNPISSPVNMSPIREATTAAASPTISSGTQTNAPEYRTQETLTTINNVRKRVDYVAWTKSDILHELKEEYDPPTPPPQIDAHSRSMIYSHIFEYEMFLFLKTLNSANRLPLFMNSSQYNTELCQSIVKFMKDKCKYPENDDKIPSDVSPHANGSIDPDDDEYSRDSVESYNSAKVKICKMRDLSNCSPELDENINQSTTNNQRSFAPIHSTSVESTRNKEMEIQTDLSPPSPIQNHFISTNQICNKVRIEKTPQVPKQCSLQIEKPTFSNSQTNNSKLKTNDQPLVDDAANFKVPKRKSSTLTHETSKRRKPSSNVSKLTLIDDFFTKQSNISVNFQNKKQIKDTLSSLFGDLSDSDDDDIDDEHIRNILNAFKRPTILSPIKELPADQPTQSSSKIRSKNGLQHLESTNEKETFHRDTSSAKVNLNKYFCQSEEKIGVKSTNHDSRLLLETVPQENDMPKKSLNESVEMEVDKCTDECIEESMEAVLSEIPESTAEPNHLYEDLLLSPESVSPGSMSPESMSPDHLSPTSLESMSEEEDNSLESPEISESLDIQQPELDSVLERTTDPIEETEKMSTTNQRCANDLDEFDDFSPASPKPDDKICTEMPPVIPINTISNKNHQFEEEEDEEEEEGEEKEEERPTIHTDSALDQIIYNYRPSMQTALKLVGNNFSNANCYLLASLRNAIEKYCLVEWSSESVTECIEKLLNLTQRSKYLATSILEVVEDTNESLSLEFTPSAPALQPSHQKCINLVHRLTQIMPTFNQYVRFELERRLFDFGKEKLVSVMTNLTHFFIALTDIEQPTDLKKVRFFIFKCLYYFKKSAVPLVFAVLMAHKNALPHVNAVESLEDPLTLAIVSSLSSIKYLDNDNNRMRLLFKRSEMFHTLKRLYGFFADKLFPTESVITYCIDCLRTNRLEHVDYALILIAKRTDCEYAVSEIIKKHLIPMLIQYFSIDLNVNHEHDEKIQTILFIIGSIVKTFPMEQNVDGYLDIFVKCLNKTQRQTIQEAAILAICQLNRFGMHKIYHHLKNWKPNYQISLQIQVTLRNFVYKRPEGFWFRNNKK